MTSITPLTSSVTRDLNAGQAHDSLPKTPSFTRKTEHTSNVEGKDKARISLDGLARELDTTFASLAPGQSLQFRYDSHPNAVGSVQRRADGSLYVRDSGGDRFVVIKNGAIDQKGDVGNSLSSLLSSARNAQ